MKKIAIVTDSNSGIQKDDKEQGLFVVPMPMVIDGEEYFENVNISYDEFYEKQIGGSDIKTAQPSVGDIQEIWDNVLKDFDCIIHIPMSSALSSTYDTAKALAQDYEGKVYVVDNKRIACSLKLSVKEALHMAKQGKEAEEIVKYLEDTKELTSIYISIPTLAYLKKGGRLTPAAALLGTMLSIKPVLQIQQGKLDSFAKCFSVNATRVKIISALKKDLETRFADKKVTVFVAFTKDKEECEKFVKQLESEIGQKVEIVDDLSLSIAVHIGPGVIACGCSVDSTKE